MGRPPGRDLRARRHLTPDLSAPSRVSGATSPWPYPLWIAHRGAGKLAPENTLAAFRLGARHGYCAFECDVKLSADGVPFREDVVELLLDAAKLVMEIEAATIEPDEERGQVYAAVSRYLEGWR